MSVKMLAQFAQSGNPWTDAAEEAFEHPVISGTVGAVMFLIAVIGWFMNRGRCTIPTEVRRPRLPLDPRMLLSHHLRTPPPSGAPKELRQDDDNEAENVPARLSDHGKGECLREEQEKRTPSNDRQEDAEESCKTPTITMFVGVLAVLILLILMMLKSF